MFKVTFISGVFHIRGLLFLSFVLHFARFSKVEISKQREKTKTTPPPCHSQNINRATTKRIGPICGCLPTEFTLLTNSAVCRKKQVGLQYIVSLTFAVEDSRILAFAFKERNHYNTLAFRVFATESQRNVCQRKEKMKVETPQILWNSEAEKGKNAPLLSVDMIESGLASDVSSVTSFRQQQQQQQPQAKDYSHVLVTAGNAIAINLWKVNFGAGAESESSTSPSSDSIFQKQTRPVNKIDFMLSLCRHDVAVNAVKFSPDGLHLVTAGDSGNIVLWSVPVHKRGNNNGRHYWSEITKESDLSVRIISTHCEGVVDLSWSADSKRFVVGTIDSCLLIYEDKNHAMNTCSPETHQKDSDWQLVYRNGEHGSFVQGVSYDPLGVYVASMGGDRTVRVFPRKTPPKSKKKVLRPSNSGGGGGGSTGGNSLSRTVTPPQEQQRLVAQLLTESKIEVGKTKRIKQRSIVVDETTGQLVKQKLFVDESNCESFFRRLSWTADGAFLVTPAALWHPEQSSSSANGEGSTDSETSFSTYLFARHRFDEPYKVLPGLEKPSVVVRPNPVLFELPGLENLAPDATKENQRPSDDDIVSNTSPCGLPYRSVFAVLTLDSVFIYDTHHSQPLSVIQGLHYAGLTDCCWSQDGMNLMVSSSDGYISIINFAAGELGRIYTPPMSLRSISEKTNNNTTTRVVELSAPPVEMPPLPPCQDSDQPTLLEGRPAKKKRISPTLVSTLESATSPPPMSVPQTATAKDQQKKNESRSNVSSASKRGIADTETEIVPAVTKLSLNGATLAVGENTVDATYSTCADETSGGNAKKKQKKRVTPVLLSSNKQ
jgi:chromatin assembly factor 1 subunit B